MNEPLLRLRIAGQLRRQEFQSHSTLEFRILGFVHNPHSAFAELFEDFVMGDDLTDHGISL